MSPFMQQLFTLLGVFLGAAATYSVTSLTERTRWRRLQDSRWDDRRLNAYVEYANAVKKCMQLSYRMAASLGMPSNGQPLDVAEGLPMLAAAEADRAVKWENVLLLGNGAVIEAGRRWHELSWKLEWFIRGKLNGDEEFKSSYEAANDARTTFYDRARRDLGITEAIVSEHASGRYWSFPA
jgi:hypothetical protein